MKRTGPSPGAVAWFRVTHRYDRPGLIRTYTGESQLTDDPLDTFGPLAVARVPDLQSLMKYICKNGFEHHVAMTMNHVAPNLSEALSTYVKWDVYHHQ